LFHVIVSVAIQKEWSPRSLAAELIDYLPVEKFTSILENPDILFLVINVFSGIADSCYNNLPLFYRDNQTMELEIREADLNDEADGFAIVDVLDSYARDPFGGGKPLPTSVRESLIEGLRDHPTTVVLLAFDRKKPIGLATCFLGFSTFQARPLLNLHDFAVVPEYRGKRVGKSLMQAVEEAAHQRGCCKLTLEVLDDNERAIKLYEGFGFSNYSLGDSPSTRFLTKSLSSE
jgi:ribosomal protein S18 acetylase RimI-like enzyme